jgi:hypothetical protein
MKLIKNKNQNKDLSSLIKLMKNKDQKKNKKYILFFFISYFFFYKKKTKIRYKKNQNKI